MASRAAGEASKPSELVSNLREVLQELTSREFPYVEGPPEAKKRASVALVVRVNPNYAHWPPKEETFALQAISTKERIDEFFQQKWVQQGEPEILFIKRATRQGDRWTGHTALPGGRRDPEDADDRATAVRETLEEVGVDLSPDNAIAAGNLPQRVVTSSWGNKAIMTLCPYIFLLTKPHTSQRLQPTEVHSSHWVPVRALLAPSLRTYEYQDVSVRVARSDYATDKWIFRGLLGRMLFAAIRLTPSESCCSDPIPSFAKNERREASLSTLARLSRRFGLSTLDPAQDSTPPLLVWGLTLGVIADFIDLLPPYNAMDLWTYPTFGMPDVRFFIWALSYRFRRARQVQTRSGGLYNPSSIEIGSEAAVSAKGNGLAQRPPEGTISGLSVGSRAWLQATRQHEFDTTAMATTLERYYDYLRKGVIAALAFRTSVLALIALWWFRRRSRSIPGQFLMYLYDTPS